ncbi:hypothetical protein SAMN05444164_4007 [Bradyrhizobium erythrophlei]|uniref:Metal-dependent phosphohydrolase n=1 Tax=Bradyrhizobium erythrophlei TaxID=1437360 RepID=A0A1H4YLM9_9BRAD|nr:hypothetical protein SAMN05444164_4007 [Bradyrhizobium erythrophlei]
MITVPELVSQALGSLLTAETKDRFGASHAGLTELLPFAAKLTLECIGNSDALYHNIEHTLLVTLAGHDILIGRALLRPTTANDYANFIFSCLTHDIGYVRGVVQGDEDGSFIADVNGGTIRLPRGSSDAACSISRGPFDIVRSRAPGLGRAGCEPRGPGNRIYPLSLYNILERQSDGKKRGCCCGPPISSGSSAIPIISGSRTRCSTNLKRLGSTKRRATRRRQTSFISIPNSIGRLLLPKFKRRYAISMSLLPAVDG